MNKAEIIALFDQDQRRDVTYPDVRREASPEVVRLVNKTPGGEGMVVYSRLTAANADAVIQEQLRHFAQIGQPFEWKLYEHDQPADLKERLRAHGFEIGEVEALLVLDLAHAPAALWQPASHDVRRITRPQDLHDFLLVEGQIWGDGTPAAGDYLVAALRDSPADMSVYVAYFAGQPATAGRVNFQENSQFASLWGGSTLPAYRKRGLYTALLAVRAQEARARQVRFLTVDASPMSRPILEKFGFQLIDYTFPCKWPLNTNP